MSSLPHITILQQTSRNVVTDIAMLNVDEGIIELLIPRQIAISNSEQLTTSPKHNTGKRGEGLPRPQKSKARARSPYGRPCSMTGPLGTATPPAGSSVIAKRSG